MTDVLTPEQRRLNMSRIRGRDTKPELLLRKALWARRVRGYRKHPNVPGRPDLAFIGKRVAVFVDGCFWHGCPIHATSPQANADFWEKKLKANVERDVTVTSMLKSDGWTVLRFWEHEIYDSLPAVVDRIADVVQLNGLQSS